LFSNSRMDLVMNLARGSRRGLIYVTPRAICIRYSALFPFCFLRDRSFLPFPPPPPPPSLTRPKMSIEKKKRGDGRCQTEERKIKKETK
jgi:hypothetical protein